MDVDLTGGLEPSRDYFFANPPEDPQIRESASMWIFDDRGLIGLPRVGIEAVGERWDTRGYQVNVAFPDGRTVVALGLGKGSSPVDQDGICRTFAAGDLEFSVIEPFETFTMTYDGPALDTTTTALASGDFSAPEAHLRIEVSASSAVPPWVSGTLVRDAAELFTGGFAGAFISPRYEQLCTSTGSVEIGEERWTFQGTSLRVHRQGPRDVEGFWGHCWPSALFPSGRAFGALAFPERRDQPTYNEGFIYVAGQVLPAILVDAPWLKRLQPYGEDVSFTLRTAEGDVDIVGETCLSSCLPGGTSPEFPPALHQAGVRYRWDGEEAFGMMERSIPVDQLEH
ncbi:MAG TPA: hypothetical protein VED63_13285 [Acidimicrobiales bacterium]|nr:hypothetical protein [Acidimicrobiales bacterium]